MTKKLFGILFLAAALLTSGNRVVNHGGAPAGPDILWWKCNEGTGTSIAATGGGAIGGTTTGTWTATTQSGTGAALVFDGSTTAVSNSSVTFGTGVITVEFWVKAAAWSSGGTNYWMFYTGVGAYGDGQWAIFNVWGGLQIKIRDNGSNFVVHCATMPATGGWHHVAVVVDNPGNAGAGALTLYYDGILQTLVTDIGDKNSGGNLANSVITIGDTFPGQIDGVRIYSGNRGATLIASDAAANAD